MEVGVLGPLVVRLNGISVIPMARKPRQVLALLAVSGGGIVSVSSLVEELWGENPPASASTTLQTYIMQVRRCISMALNCPSNESAKNILRTCYSGYVLDVDKADLDANRFQSKVDTGRQFASEGRLEEASALLQDALSIWRGEFLADVHTGPRLTVASVRLHESYLEAVERRIDIDLRLRRHRSILPELSTLTADHPMNEALWSQYIIALYRSGRAGQALTAYRQLRKTLIAELGIEPSPEVQALHRGVLKSDRTLDIQRSDLPTTMGEANDDQRVELFGRVRAGA